MRRSLLALLTVVLAVSAAGCNGPKSDCEGTMQSFASIVDGNHWDDFPDLVYPPVRKKYGDATMVRWISGTYEGARSFKFSAMQASVSKDVCFAQTLSHWEQKIRGHMPETFDEEYAYTLHLVDGKWYMEPPGSAKLSAY